LKKQNQKKEVIAIRKTCKATGTGLSHYVMMERPKK
jgi:modified peptide precursor CbpA